MRSPDPPEIDDLLRRFREGSVEALARLFSLVENHPQLRGEIISRIYPIERQPAVIGVTGSAGVGKSTLVSGLVAHFKRELSPVAVLGFDPSSRFSGGALLGDRVRMGEHALDEKVYVRSVASRGVGGGTGRIVHEALDLLSAFGFELVILETVGAGQGDTEVLRNADLVVVVTAPGQGDQVQAMKAGLLEIGDVVVFNKADLPGADAEATMLADTLAMGRAGGRPPIDVCSTVAAEGAGVEALSRKLLEMHRGLDREGLLVNRRRDRRRAHLESVLRERLLALLGDLMQDAGRAGDAAGQGASPYLLADRVMGKVVPGAPDRERVLLGVDHIGIAVENLQESLEVYRDRMGMEFLGMEIVEEQKVRVGVLKVGDIRVELLEATADDSPVARFLARGGRGVHHVAYVVRDLQKAVQWCERNGLRLIDRTGRIGAGGARIVFLHPASTGGLLTELTTGTGDGGE